MYSKQLRTFVCLANETTWHLDTMSTTAFTTHQASTLVRNCWGISRSKEEEIWANIFISSATQQHQTIGLQYTNYIIYKGIKISEPKCDPRGTPDSALKGVERPLKFLTTNWRTSRSAIWEGNQCHIHQFSQLANLGEAFQMLWNNPNKFSQLD